MASGHVPTVLRCLRRFLRSVPAAEDNTDAHLLERFVARRDESAFETILQRHGPMVLGVCRRLLRHTEDAEDAFQATFLILARKAAGLRRRELLGPWLYGVATRTATRARVELAKRRAREQRVIPRASEPPDDGPLWRDLRPVLDEEVGRLPERYRGAFVLCYLEGLTNKEAAKQLGCPEGTVLSRLAWARERLRARLTRRGVTLSAGAISAALAEGAAAAVPAELMTTTATAAVAVAAGRAVAATVPAQIAALTEEVLRTMWLTKMKVTVALALAVVVVGIGLGVVYPAPAQGEAQTPSQQAAPPEATATAAPQTGSSLPQPAGGTQPTQGKDPDPSQISVKGEKKSDVDVTKDLIPVLIEALRDKDDEIRAVAGQTLYQLGRKAVPALLPLLSGKDPELRRAAIRILGGMGEGLEEVVVALNRYFLDEKALAEALADQDDSIRVVAQAAVLRLGKVAVPTLVRMLEGKDRQLRGMAATVLGELGSKAREAVPALTRMFQEAKVQQERREILMAISRIVEPPQAGGQPPGPGRGKLPRGPGPSTLP
jgi:RNA polymerase sigma factor (sigma-70 family)